MAMTLLERFRLLVPAYQSVFGDSEVQSMLAIADSPEYRPSCLVESKQEEAVVLYAAYLLSLKEAGFDQDMQEAAWFRRAGITTEREGDLTRSYSKREEGETLDSDPRGFYARWKKLNRVCRRLEGSIGVGTGDFDRSLPQGFRRGGW